MAYYSRNNTYNKNVRIAIPVVSACATVYDNQTTINSLNSLLANAQTLGRNKSVDCSAPFIQAIERELLRQIAIGKVISRDCSAIAYENPVTIRRY